MMKDAEAQYLALSPTSNAHDDAPDSGEGCVFEINDRTMNDVSKVETIAYSSRNPLRL